MDTGIVNETQEILQKFWRNLPLALLTTVTVSLIVAFWKKLFLLAKRCLGLAEPPQKPLRPTLPEGEIARIFSIGKVRGGFSIEAGWRGAVLDAGVVQRELGPGRYKRRTVSRMIERHGLREEARIAVWRDKEFPVVLVLAELFTSDHHAMQLIIGAIFRLDPARLLQSSMEEMIQPPEKIAERLSERIALPTREWMASRNAGEIYSKGGSLPQGAQLAADWIQGSMQGSPFDLVRVTEFRLTNAAFDQLYRVYGELALDNEKARQELERNQVRGALRQAVLAGKLAELRDEQQYEDAVRFIEQEKSLREKALNLELVQADFDELQRKLHIWKSKRDWLLEAIGSPQPEALASPEGSGNLADRLRRGILNAADSPYSAQEQQQIRDLLQACQARSAESLEVLKAVVEGSGIPRAVLDPAAMIAGDHTLRVGDGWRVFDGDNLWQIRLTRIATRRHGFLWNQESPDSAFFETRGALQNRRLEQEVALKGTFRLKVGRHEIPAEYLGGTPSRISLRIQ